MGRRKLYEVAVHFRITDVLNRRLEAIAEADQSTPKRDLSAVMRQALEDYADAKEMLNDGTRTSTTNPGFAGS